MEMNAYISYIIYPLIYEFIGWPLCKKHFKYIRFVVPPPPKGIQVKEKNIWICDTWLWVKTLVPFENPKNRDSEFM